MEKNCILWDVTPCTPLKISRRFGVVCHLCLQDRRISQTIPACSRQQVGFSTLKVDLTFSSQTAIDLQWATRRFMPEDRTGLVHRCENRKSCINFGLSSLSNCLDLSATYFQFHRSRYRPISVVCSWRQSIWMHAYLHTHHRE